MGCSPDGLVNNDGLVEIKSVIDHVQYKTIKRGTFDPSYRWQLVFNLKRTEREWIDYVSYCADFPDKTKLYVYRINKDECDDEFMMMRARFDEFFSLVESIKNTIKGE